MENNNNNETMIQESSITNEDDSAILVQEIVEEALQSRFGGFANVSLPDPSTASYYQDKADRIIYLEEEINEDSVYIINRIIRYNLDDTGIPVEDRIPIWLYINSPGGLLFESNAIADAVYNSKTPVYAINVGECSSGAAYIYASCKRRYAYPNAFFLLHSGSGGTSGTFQQTKAHQRHYEHMVQTMYSMIAQRLKVTERDTFNRLIETEWFLYTNDTDFSSEHCAKRFNLITHELHNVIIEDEDED